MESRIIIKCPRCDSVNNKFCYFNNYNLSQPRHFCKSCRRYWTRGGVLRNVPVGGACRKNKRSSKPKPRPDTTTAAAAAPPAHSHSSSDSSTLTAAEPPQVANGEFGWLDWGGQDDGLFDTADHTYWSLTQWSHQDH